MIEAIFATGVLFSLYYLLRPVVINIKETRQQDFNKAIQDSYEKGYKDGAEDATTDFLESWDWEEPPVRYPNYLDTIHKVSVTKKETPSE